MSLAIGPKGYFAILCLTSVTGLVLGQTPTNAPLPKQELRTFATVFGVLKDALVPKVKDEAIIVAAIKGMVRELDPDGGEYFTEEEFAVYKAGVAAQASIGLQIRQRLGEIIIIPKLGGAAEEAGLQHGDLLVAIDGKPTKGLAAAQMVGLIRGPVGSKVRLQFLRGCTKILNEVTIERAIEKLQSVSVRRPNRDIVILRIPANDAGTLKDTATKLIEEWRKQPFKGLVMDLRRNPGGLVDVSVGLASIFLPANLIVAKTADIHPSENQTYFANKATYARQAANDPLAEIPIAVRGIPLAVLVDEETAAGAELIAAALKDHQRATIIGRRTFGRGSLQTITELAPGSGAIKFTSGYWESPLGTRLHGNGVQPHEVIEQSDPENELNAAIVSLSNRI